MIVRILTVNDRLIPLKARLFRPGGTPVVLEADDEVFFRMVDSAGTVKVNNTPATILDRGNASTHTAAEVQYDWNLLDTDTAGTYTAWFIRTSGGKPEHFPNQDPDNPELQVIFRAES